MISQTSLPILAFLAMSAVARAADPAAPPADTITVANAVTRATPPGAPTGIGYMTIANGGDRPDRLVAASSPAVDHVEIHEMAVKDGVMTMHPVPGGLPVPAHGSVALAPGGYHLMLIGPKQPFKAGDDVPVTLTFDRAGQRLVHLAVEPMGAPAPTAAR